MPKDDMMAVVKAEVGENRVQYSVYDQLLRSVGTHLHDWKYSMPPCYLYKTSETNRSRTVQSEGSRIGWKLVVPLFITVKLLNDHCVLNYIKQFMYHILGKFWCRKFLSIKIPTQHIFATGTID